jgi:hypothetical protein
VTQRIDVRHVNAVMLEAIEVNHGMAGAAFVDPEVVLRRSEHPAE